MRLKIPAIKNLWQQVQLLWVDQLARIWLILLVVVGFLLMATLIYQTYDVVHVVTTSGVGAVKVGQKRSVEAEKNPILTLEKSPIFGVKPKELTTRVNTKFTLLGVMIASNNKDSKAILTTQNGDADVYQVGDKLPDGSSLVRVYQDRVTLRRLGSLETVYLNWEKFIGGPAPVRMSPSTSPKAEAIKERLQRFREQILERENNPRSINPDEIQKRIEEMRKRYPNFRRSGESNTFDRQIFLNNLRNKGSM